MIKNHVMRKADPLFKLQADSLVEIRRGIRDQAERLSDAGLRHNGTVLRPANLINAIATWYLGLDDTRKELIAREGLRLFEARLESDNPKIVFANPGDVVIIASNSIRSARVNPGDSSTVVIVDVEDPASFVSPEKQPSTEGITVEVHETKPSPKARKRKAN